MISCQEVQCFLFLFQVLIFVCKACLECQKKEKKVRIFFSASSCFTWTTRSTLITWTFTFRFYKTYRLLLNLQIWIKGNLQIQIWKSCFDAANWNPSFMFGRFWFCWFLFPVGNKRRLLADYTALCVGDEGIILQLFLTQLQMSDSSENETPGCSWTLKPLNAGPHFLCPCLHFCLPPNPTFLLPGIFEEWVERGFSVPLMQPAVGEQRISDTRCSFAFILSRLNEEYFNPFSPSVFCQAPEDNNRFDL